VDVFEKLAQKMDAFPLGAPPGEPLAQVLKALFSPQEAEAALCLGPRPQPLTKLAQASGQDQDSLGAVLEGMVAKGLVYARQTGRDSYYSLLPVFPGIFELQFMAGQRGPAKTRLAQLFENYYVQGMGRAFVQTETRFARVLPVERQVPLTMEILPFERVSNFIKEEIDFALAVCYCRHEKELLGQACDAPKDVCMVFGPFARFCVERDFARRVSLAEMLSALERAEAAGLVHVSDNVTDRINFLCNCCGCCCGFLRTITELGQANVVAASRFVAHFAPDECTLCLTCVDKCQIKAITSNGQEISLDQDRCLGCGACVNLCPSGSLSLQPRPDYSPPFQDLPSLHGSLLKERGLLK